MSGIGEARAFDSRDPGGLLQPQLRGALLRLLRPDSHHSLRQPEVTLFLPAFLEMIPGFSFYVYEGGLTKMNQYFPAGSVLGTKYVAYRFVSPSLRLL